MLKNIKNVIYLKKPYYFISTQSYLRKILLKILIYFDITSVL